MKIYIKEESLFALVFIVLLVTFLVGLIVIDRQNNQEKKRYEEIIEHFLKE